MGNLIYGDGTLEKNVEISDNAKDNRKIIGYIYKSQRDTKDNINIVTNIHEDIVIRNKDSIVMNIPFINEGNKCILNMVVEKDMTIINYESGKLIEFYEEKLALYSKVDKLVLTLFVFEYFLFTYTDELLNMEEKVEQLFEDAVYKGSIKNEEILVLKKEVSLIKRYVTYYKSLLSYLDDEFDGVQLYERVLFKVENTMNLVENIEAAIYSSIDIYNSVISNKMNKTMQLLTIITVAFLPLTIITGVFGMNFSEMPLLQNPYGFFIAMGATLMFVILQLIYFKFKKYI